MEEKNKTKFYIICGVVVFVVLILVIVLWSKSATQQKTGGLGNIKNDKDLSINVTGVSDAGFPAALYKDFANNISDAMTTIDPSCGENAKVKDVKRDGDEYTFVINRCGSTYNVELSHQGKKSYNFSILHNGTKLVDYDSEKGDIAYLNPQSISRYLPLQLNTEDGTAYTLRKESNVESLELTIGVDNCGKQEIKDKALASAKEVLEYTGFNPEDFTYKIPNYCDSAGSM